MPMRVMVAVPDDRRERMTRRPGIARTAPTAVTATVTSTAGVEDRDEPATTVAATMTEVTATEMAPTKSAGADAGEATAAEAAAETAKVTAAETAGVSRC
jgi:hypothetical protein